MWLEHWKGSPGSPESQHDLHACRQEIQGLVDSPREAGFCGLTVCAGGHYTLLLLTREATPDSQEIANKFVVVYKDSLLGQAGKGHNACRRHAEVALSFLVAAFPAGWLSQTSLPAVAPSAKQVDSTSCGFFVTGWLEEEYRLIRGEGMYRMPEKFHEKAASLNRWNKNVLTAKPKAKAKAKAQAGSTGPVPLVDLVAGCPEPPPSTASSSSQAVGPPTAPVSQSDIFGCSRCRYAAKGCATCNPVKAAAKAAKDVQTDQGEAQPAKKAKKG